MPLELGIYAAEPIRPHLIVSVQIFLRERQLMSELEQFFCPNEQCKDYGLRRRSNISIRGTSMARTKAAICCTVGPVSIWYAFVG